MAADPKAPGALEGVIRIRNHCTFNWREPEGGGRRTVKVTPAHCAKCVAELRELGFLLAHEDRRDG